MGLRVNGPRNDDESLIASTAEAVLAWCRNWRAYEANLYVQVDMKLGRFGDEHDYYVIRGYWRPLTQRLLLITAPSEVRPRRER